MTEKERRQVRHHLQASADLAIHAWRAGALIATAKIVQTVPDLDAKFYAATQVMDERGMSKPIPACCTTSSSWPIRSPTAALAARNRLSDSRWT